MINSFFFLVMAAVIGIYLLDLGGRLLNLRALGSALPAEFADVFDADEYARSQQYIRDGTRFAIVEESLTLLLFLAFWLAGGFGWLDERVRDVSDHSIVQGLLYFGVLFLAWQLVDLPLTLYGIFVIEERYGFNKMTLGTFFADLAKTLALAALFGAPLLALVLFLFEYFGGLAWLLGWVFVSGFSLLLSYLAPRLILPLFHKFTPLGEGELREAIRQLAEKCGFPLAEVYEIDGSRRSTKANAFFTGLGKNKKIALFDTLVQNYSVSELVAVLAHEVGHYKKRHITKSLVLSVLQTGALFFVLGLFLNNRGLFDAFGVERTSIYGSLLFFAMLFQPISKLLSVGMMIFSRKNEFEADAYAAQATGRPEDLISGLKRLSKDNLSNLTPHPFFVFMNYSHPPVLERIQALRCRDVERNAEPG